MPYFKKTRGFTLRSGNKPPFRMMGSPYRKFMPGTTDPPTETNIQSVWDIPTDIYKNLPSPKSTGSISDLIKKKIKTKVTQVATDIKKKRRTPPNDVTGIDAWEELKDYAKIILK